MPLSEHEENILAEIERRLAADDPDFVERARKTSPVDRRVRRLLVALGGFAVGFVMLLGLTIHLAIGAAGFALMLVSVVVGVSALADASADTRAAVVARIRSRFGRHDHAS